MLPVIALVGRPNVGKSTLFNRLTRSRDALVYAEPGLTRDRQYGLAKIAENTFIVVDTAGLMGQFVDTSMQHRLRGNSKIVQKNAVLSHCKPEDTEPGDALNDEMVWQVTCALDEADHILFLVDGRAGLNAADDAIAVWLRRFDTPISLLVNKTEGVNSDSMCSDFFALGVGAPYAISATHGDGIADVVNMLDGELASLEAKSAVDSDAIAGCEKNRIRIAVIGRPNVGKSTLVNQIVGEQRVVVCDQPGTTRDSITIPFEKDGNQFALIDTAGVRRKARIHSVVEKYSVVKTMQTIGQVHVVIFVIDGCQELTTQDLTFLSHVLAAGRAFVIAVNKCDKIGLDARRQLIKTLPADIPFANFAEILPISASNGFGVRKLLSSILRAHESANVSVSTARLTTILSQAVSSHEPPYHQGRRIKLRYAHQGGHRPPTIIIHGNQAGSVPDPYKRYLLNTYRKALNLRGTPIKIEFKTSDNPYIHKKKDKRVSPQLLKSKRTQNKLRKK